MVSCHLHIMMVLLLFQFVYHLFLFFVCFLWLKISMLCLIKVVKVDILVFILILKTIIQVFLVKYYVSCGFVICGLYHVEVCFLYSHFAESCYRKWVLDFVKCLFCLYWYDHIIFIFHFVYVMYHIIWFADIVPTLYPRNKFHWITVYDIFNVLLNLVC